MVFTFNTTTREVLEQVVRDPRFKDLTRLPVFAPMEIALGVGAYLLFGIGCWLYLLNYIPFLLMLLINSFAIYMSFTPLHDATHRSVSSNRRVNDAVGTLCCLLLLPGITTRIYRYLHLEHHRHAGTADKDPDESFVSTSPWLLPFVLAGLDVHWTIWYCKQWYTRPVDERIEFVACLCFYACVHMVFLLSPYALEFVLCFMIPQRFGLFYVSWFFAHIQHPEGVEWEQAPFQTTVRVETNRLGSSLLLGQAWHCLHHLAPSVPYYRYQKAWVLGAHLFEQQHVPTRTLWRKSQNILIPKMQATAGLTAKIDKVIGAADGVLAYELVPGDNANWPRFTAGAHLDVKLKEGLVRQYSLCNSPAESQRYRIAVKLNPESSGGSEFLHTQVQKGDSLEISVPRNNFPLAFDAAHYLLIAGGIGITPLIAMAYALHDRGLSFQLHVFARKETDIAFHQALATLPFADAVMLHCDRDNAPAKSMLSKVVSSYADESALYVCGPVGFMAQVLDLAKAASWPSSRIFSESFVAARIDNTTNKPFEVKIASTGEVIAVAADQHLIDVLHDHGLPVMCSCTQGVCGSCITPVLEGVPDHRDAVLSDDQRAANRAMTVCVSRAISDRLVLDL